MLRTDFWIHSRGRQEYSRWPSHGNKIATKKHKSLKMMEGNDERRTGSRPLA